MRAGMTLTECLVSILLVSILSLIIFSMVSTALLSHNIYIQQNSFSNFATFAANEIYIRGVRDSSIISLADELTRKYYKLEQGEDLTGVYPRVANIQVSFQANIPGTNLPAARVVEITFCRNAKGLTERIFLIQGRP